MPAEQSAVKLTKADFQSDQAIRWCPGCGDYVILAQVQKVLPELGIARENHVFVSGIGCSSRFPYYMNTYGFHTIHGRAPAIATGLKLARPELTVWVVTGDGDGLSIGGNHLIHALRRNVDLNILLFNNEIYGLTKGQPSPTSEFGKKTKSSPMGTVDMPLKPLNLALACGATFVARSIDREPVHLAKIVERTAAHRGTSLLEIYQNCNIFNDGAFDSLTDRKIKADTQIMIEHGKPLLFGEKQSKGIMFKGFTPVVVNVADVGLENIHVHDEKGEIAYHQVLARMTGPEFPTPLGVIRAVEQPTYDSLVTGQIDSAVKKSGQGSLQSLLRGGETWTVK